MARAANLPAPPGLATSTWPRPGDNASRRPGSWSPTIMTANRRLSASISSGPAATSVMAATVRKPSISATAAIQDHRPSTRSLWTCKCREWWTGTDAVRELGLAVQEPIVAVTAYAVDEAHEGCTRWLGLRSGFRFKQADRVGSFSRQIDPASSHQTRCVGGPNYN